MPKDLQDDRSAQPQKKREYGWHQGWSLSGDVAVIAAVIYGCEHDEYAADSN